MELRHKCLKCNHPCEVSLALTSVNCSNELCEFYGIARPPEDKSDSTPAKEPPKGWKENLRESIAKNMAELPCPVTGCAGRIAITFDEVVRGGTVCMQCHTCFKFKDGIHGEKIIEVVGVGGVKTGRLSSKEPNISNTPKPNAEIQDNRKWSKRASFADVWAKPMPVEGMFQELAAEMLPDAAEPFTTLEERYLRWPKTMRVVDREAVNPTVATHAISKDGRPLLGVLCLVDTALDAKSSTYNYIAFGEKKESVRATILVTQHSSPKKHRERPPAARKEFESKIGTRENFTARILRTEAERLHISEVHLPAIKLEFELDRVRPLRTARRPTSAEQALFKLLKK